MTETTEPTRTAEPQIITDAVEIIDSALGGFLHRELVSSGEVTDVLLDVRMLLRRGDESAEMPAASTDGGLTVAGAKHDSGVARA